MKRNHARDTEQKVPSGPATPVGPRSKPLPSEALEEPTIDPLQTRVSVPMVVGVDELSLQAALLVGQAVDVAEDDCRVLIQDDRCAWLDSFGKALYAQIRTRTSTRAEVLSVVESILLSIATAKDISMASTFWDPNLS